jgi:hypothetical protein
MFDMIYADDRNSGADVALSNTIGRLADISGVPLESAVKAIWGVF